MIIITQWGKEVGLGHLSRMVALNQVYTSRIPIFKLCYNSGNINLREYIYDDENWNKGTLINSYELDLRNSRTVIVDVPKSSITDKFISFLLNLGLKIIGIDSLRDHMAILDELIIPSPYLDLSNYSSEDKHKITCRVFGSLGERLRFNHFVLIF